MKSQERTWRHGRPSGNRYIIAACETLAKQYRLVRTFDFPEACQLGDIKVMIYVRPQK